MSDDWRMTIEVAGEHGGLGLLEAMRETRAENEARRRLGDRVAVSADGPRLFLYADTEAAAREAARLVGEVLERHDLQAVGSHVARWHPVEERWEDAGEPLPATEDERRAEHEEAEARDAERTEDQGFAEWEVRAELPSHAETVAFAERLEGERLPVVRRWTYLLIGAATEDDAHALAERVRAEAPQGTRVEAELSGAAVWRATDPYPFAVFGGLGG